MLVDVCMFIIVIIVSIVVVSYCTNIVFTAFGVLFALHSHLPNESQFAYVSVSMLTKTSSAANTILYTYNIYLYIYILIQLH